MGPIHEYRNRVTMIISRSVTVTTDYYFQIATNFVSVYPQYTYMHAFGFATRMYL